jgi:hypothetical protein
VRWHHWNPMPVPLVLRHRRDWRGLWLSCRCGRWWRSCPDHGRSVLLHQVLPRPDLPPQLALRGTDPDVPPPLPRLGRNAGPGWNEPTRIRPAATLGEDRGHLIRGGRW